MELSSSTIDDAMHNAPDKKECAKCLGLGFQPADCCAGFECDCNGEQTYIYCDCGIKPDLNKILKLSEL